MAGIPETGDGLAHRLPNTGQCPVRRATDPTRPLGTRPLCRLLARTATLTTAKGYYASLAAGVKTERGDRTQRLGVLAA
jgi:hypothetical protein